MSSSTQVECTLIQPTNAARRTVEIRWDFVTRRPGLARLAASGALLADIQNSETADEPTKNDESRCDRGQRRPGSFQLQDMRCPNRGKGEVLIKVAAAGVNRPDVLQRQGHYPPPKGHSELPGLEVSGVIAALGDGVKRFAAGDAVLALYSGGGYAEYAVARGCAASKSQKPFRSSKRPRSPKPFSLSGTTSSSAAG